MQTKLHTAIRKAIADNDVATLRELVRFGDEAEEIRDTNAWPYVRAAARKVIRNHASTTWEERISIDRDAVLLADAEWAADLGNAIKESNYKIAKKTYRDIERAAFKDGFHWTCGRCGGDGRWVNGGVCFNCGGSGFHPNQTPYKFEASPAIRAKRQAEHEAKVAAENDRYEASLATLPSEVADALRKAEAEYNRIEGYYNPETGEELGKEDAFRYSLACKLRKWGSLSEKQIAAVERGLNRDKARQDEAEALKSVEPLAEGRYTIEGEVLSTKWQEGDYGTTFKMLVKMDDGNKVWGTVPASIEFDPKGARLSFAATVTRSGDDDHFGFFKRPGKAEVVRSADDNKAEVN